MTNGTTQTLVGEQDLDNPRRWLFQRQTQYAWNDLFRSFNPLAGQSVRIRESIEIFFELTTIPPASNLWFNRYANEAFIGHFQVSRTNANDADTNVITERGQIIGNSFNTTSFSWMFQREYDLNFHLARTDINPASLSAIYNCNADLAPGAVPNRNLDTTNVDAYVRIAYALATADLANAATLIDSLLLPTIAGYTYPEDVLFRAINQIPYVNLDGQIFSTRLGNIGLWVHPDWTVNPDAFYGIQVINWGILDQTQDQFPDGATCAYPAGFDFP